MEKEFIFSSTPLGKGGSKRPRLGSNTCPKCDVLISDTTVTYTCSVCELKFCLPCTNISVQLHTAIQSDSSGNFKWTCNTCKQNFPSMSGLVTQLQTIDERNESRMNMLEAKISGFDKTMTSKIKDEMGVMKDTVVADVKSDLKLELQKLVRNEVREIDDQKLRSLNLVCFNMPESDSKEASVRKISDEKQFRSLAESLSVKDVDMKVCFRLGNAKDKRVRPLKIVLNNKRQRKMLLDNAKHIKKNAPSDLKKCILVKDLTVQQREENKTRRENKVQTQKKDDLLQTENPEGQVTSEQREKLNDTCYLSSQSQNILKPLNQLGAHAISSSEELTHYFDETIMEGVLMDNSTPHHVQIRVENDSDSG